MSKEKPMLYMTVEEFSEVLLTNVYAMNSFEPNEKYHPADLAITFVLSAEITGATMEHIIAKQHQMNRNTNETN